jgi:putative solute:sodium symporter small subunit
VSFAAQHTFKIAVPEAAQAGFGKLQGITTVAAAPGRCDMATKMTEEQAKAYWRRNLSLMFKLLVVWFVVSFGCGILLFDFLNQFQLGGYKLGFWFAQQGSIYVFVMLIFVYRWRMSALDREFDVEED